MGKHVLAINDTSDDWLNVALAIGSPSGLAEVSSKGRVCEPARLTLEFFDALQAPPELLLVFRILGVENFGRLLELRVHTLLLLNLLFLLLLLLFALELLFMGVLIFVVEVACRIRRLVMALETLAVGLELMHQLVVVANVLDLVGFAISRLVFWIPVRRDEIVSVRILVNLNGGGLRGLLAVAGGSDVSDCLVVQL